MDGRRWWIPDLSSASEIGRDVIAYQRRQDAGHLIVGTPRAPGGSGSLTSYHVLDLATGALRGLPIDDAPAVPGSLRVGRQ